MRAAIAFILSVLLTSSLPAQCLPGQACYAPQASRLVTQYRAARIQQRATARASRRTAPGQWATFLPASPVAFVETAPVGWAEWNMPKLDIAKAATDKQIVWLECPTCRSRFGVDRAIFTVVSGF